MKITTVYRITALRYSLHALSGDGARLYGGRWNRKGIPAVYTASSRSLAVLEMLVHDPMILARYAMVTLALPQTLAQSNFSADFLQSQVAGGDWRNPFSNALQPIGNDWLLSGKGAVLQVPSVVIPEETNWILNPSHPDFAQIAIAHTEPLNIDPRLIAVYQSRFPHELSKEKK